MKRASVRVNCYSDHAGSNVLLSCRNRTCAKPPGAPNATPTPRLSVNTSRRCMARTSTPTRSTRDMASMALRRDMDMEDSGELTTIPRLLRCPVRVSSRRYVNWQAFAIKKNILCIFSMCDIYRVLN